VKAAFATDVIPAKAGIKRRKELPLLQRPPVRTIDASIWIPAFAGMTSKSEALDCRERTDWVARASHARQRPMETVGALIEKERNVMPQPVVG
jgi:hypothetical protein